VNARRAFDAQANGSYGMKRRAATGPKAAPQFAQLPVPKQTVCMAPRLQDALFIDVHGSRTSSGNPPES